MQINMLTDSQYFFQLSHLALAAWSKRKHSRRAPRESSVLSTAAVSLNLGRAGGVCVVLQGAKGAQTA